MRNNLFLKILMFCYLSINCSNPVGPENDRLKLLWQRDFDPKGGAPSDITIDGNYLYFQNSALINGRLYKLSKDNKELQSYISSVGNSFGAPSIDDSNVYAGTAGGSFYAVNKATMKPVWEKYGFNWVAVGSVDESHTYVTEENEIHCYDKNNGNEIWKQTVFGKNFYNPAIENNRLYFATGFGFKQDGYLYCLDKYDGSIIFQDTIPYMESRAQFGGSGSGVAIWNNYVFIPANNWYLYCFNKNNGALIWKFLADSPMENVPRISDGILYIGSLNRTCYAIDAATGKLIWSVQTTASIARFPTSFYGDYVLFPTLGAFLVLNKNTGESIVYKTSSTSNYSFVNAVFDKDGKIYASGGSNDPKTRVLLCYQFF